MFNKYSGQTTQELKQLLRKKKKAEGRFYNFFAILCIFFIVSLVIVGIFCGLLIMFAVGIAELVILLILSLCVPDTIGVEVELKNRSYPKTQFNVNYADDDIDKLLKDMEQKRQEREQKEQAKNQKALGNIAGLYLMDKIFGGHLFGK